MFVDFFKVPNNIRFIHLTAFYICENFSNIHQPISNHTTNMTQTRIEIKDNFYFSQIWLQGDLPIPLGIGIF